MSVKRNIIITLFIYSSLGSILPKEISQNQKIYLDLRIKDHEDYWQQYQTIILGVPILLKNISPQSHIVAIIPDNLEGVGPLEDEAIFIEGARTALAWLKSYEQVFKSQNISFEIVKESDTRTINNAPSVEFLTIFPSRSFRASNPASREMENDFTIPPSASLGLPAEAVGEGCEANGQKTIEPLWPDTNKKCYLITGGAGFIGSHLCKRFLKEGHRVIALDNLSCCTGQNIKDILNNPDFMFVKHDVCVPFQVTHKIDGIIHCASIPSPANYYKMPLETMAVGLQGTRNTLELCVEHNARYLITSTSEVYGDPEIHPQVESYAGNVECMGLRSAYDQSKRGAETLIKLYYERYGLDVRIARVFNTYGPGMLRDGRVVINFSAAILENKPMVIYGDGMQTRSLCYIDDTVDGLYRLCMYEGFNKDNPVDQRVFNIGNPGEYTINEIAAEFQKLSLKYLHKEATSLKIENPDKGDPKKRKPDITRAQTILGFSPQICFKDGLEKTFSSFLEANKR